MADMRISEDFIIGQASLVNEIEDQRDAFNDALKSAWSDYREELKLLGLTGKEIAAEVAALKSAISDTRMTAEDRAKAEEKADGKDGYLAILSGPRARARIREAKSEPQPTKAAGSDLTNPQALNGQVADIQPETANEARDESGHVAVDAADHSLDGNGNAATQRNPGGENVDAPDVPAIPTTEHASGKTAGASAPAAPAPKYAAPGEITYETHPPEGVERSSVSMAFGNMGQDPVLIAHDLEKGTAQPIVKQGKVILDGWARFMQARDMRELDGQPMAYAVVQYDGEDPLIDAIRMNVDGRTLDDHQKKLIAAKLAQQNPKRKDDIYRAFEIFLEPL